LVIARCAPNTKVRMIEALHRRNAFCAMTGDGVNDSPSLKRADVGIAMGMAGSDVAKNASDIVLTDDNFASIVNAIEEGRRMFDNIKKFILQLLAENIAQACTLLIGLVFKDQSGISVFPLAPVEILWIIMVTSGFPAMGLGMEIAAPDIMNRPPHNLKQGVFTWEVCLDMAVYGFWAGALCLTAFSLVVFAFGDGKPRCWLQRHAHSDLPTSFPRPRNNIHLSNLVRPLPSLGNGQHASFLFSHATWFQTLFNPMDPRRLAKSIPFLEYCRWFCHCLSNHLYPGY